MSAAADRCGYDAAAYALGALDAHELTAFRTHLEACAICRDELAAFERVAALLPLAVAQVRAPSGVRRHVRAELRDDVRAVALPRRSARHRFPALGARLGRPIIGLACAAVLAVGGTVAALTAAGSSRPLSPARVYTASVSAPGSTGELRVFSGRARLVVHRMPAARIGHVYEVWLQPSGEADPQPTRALFNVGASGDASVAVPGAVAHLDRVLVTEEPAGGTAVPTTTPVLVATL